MIIDGKKSSGNLKDKQQVKIATLSQKPKLVIIQVGDNDASNRYVNHKLKYGEAIGATVEIRKYDSSLTEVALRQEIIDLNRTEDVNGILVQLPLPNHLNEQVVIETIDPQKDVDGFHPYNLGKLLIGLDTIIPCTVAGVHQLLSEYEVELTGKHICMIGRSNIVGKPLANLLVNYGATVTICNSKTSDLQRITQKADIIISAIGQPKFFTKEYFGTNMPVVIDVGMNLDEDGKLCGDVDFNEVQGLCSKITPVPGGVGPMTVSFVFENLLKCVDVQTNVK
ncbi:MAG: bifunctional 5,10-methylenetetrahydrofolate dehydrogenase/5,10-methenyltetrahydrofolate cyclohydrolase [Mycoplasmatales bacterium]